jgi:hypothetical protein
LSSIINATLKSPGQHRISGLAGHPFLSIIVVFIIIPIIIVVFIVIVVILVVILIVVIMTILVIPVLVVIVLIWWLGGLVCWAAVGERRGLGGLRCWGILGYLRRRKLIWGWETDGSGRVFWRAAANPNDERLDGWCSGWF